MSVSTQAEAEASVIVIPLGGIEQDGPLTGRTVARSRLKRARFEAAWLRAAIREPLLHFLLAGAALLALSSLFGNAGATAQDRIEVSAAEIGRLREIWTRQWGHAPDSKQLDNLVADYVREEIYYREARASGLEQDDTIVRRRLVEKMEFLSQEIASGEPSEADLEQFFEANRQKYSLPAEVGFTHCYFSTARRGGSALEDARAALARLTSKGLSAREAGALAASLGDSFMLQSEYPPQTRDQIKNLFGEEFADGVLDLQPGPWAGPIRSSYGWHLVRVTDYTPPRQPTLSEVRNQVAIDFKNQRLQTASENYYARLRRRYTVEIDQKALAAAKTQAPQPGAGQPAGSAGDGGTPPDLD
jgi:peptidyl-prolyl cis-trans isomerase C